MAHRVKSDAVNCVFWLGILTSALCLSGRHLSIRCLTTPEWLDKALRILAMPFIVVACLVLALLPRRIGSSLLEKLVGK
jgi:hypothetical protein